MANDSNSPSRLAFSSQCTPGSVAEQKEQERLAGFQRAKALQRAEDELKKPELAARREEAYEAAAKANMERMKKSRAMRAAEQRYR